METVETRSKFLTIRVNPDVHKSFRLKAAAYGGVSEVLRELVSAFIDERVIVSPNPERKSIYHVTRSQN